MVQKPPIQVPSISQPVVDLTTGRITEAWYGFFYDLTSAATPFEELIVGASPFSFTAVHPGMMLVKGGTVSGIDLTRARITIATGLTAGFFPMSQGDVITVTWSGVPEMWYIPVGCPA